MKQVTQVGVDVDSEALVCAMQCAGQRMPVAAYFAHSRRPCGAAREREPQRRQKSLGGKPASTGWVLLARAQEYQPAA
jgi:hypothetical protein